MDQNMVDARIAAKLSGASSSEQNDMKIENGSEPLKPQPVGKHQIESSVHMSTWKEVDEKPKAIQPATQITMQDSREIAPSEVVEIGNVTLAPSGLTGFERAFTRNASDWTVTVDGKPVQGHDAPLAALYAALLAQKKAGK